MNLRALTANLAVSIAVAGIALAPAASFADDDKGRGQARGKSKSHWNSKSPKKYGRHDNRRWNQDRDDEWRRTYDLRRREEWNWASFSPYDGRDLLDRNSDRRQQTKNEWRNLAIAGGIVTLLGALNKDDTLTFVGAAGTLYSLYRYEQDRKSQSRYDRARAYYFSQPYFYRGGVRYERRLVTKNGKKYYQFRRA